MMKKPWRYAPRPLQGQLAESGGTELIRTLAETAKLLSEGASPEEALPAKRAILSWITLLLFNIMLIVVHLDRPAGCRWMLEIYFPTVPEFRGKHDPKLCFNMCKGKKAHSSRPVCRLCKRTVANYYGIFDWDESFRHLEQECTGMNLHPGGNDDVFFRAAIVKMDDPYMWVTGYMEELKLPPGYPRLEGGFFISGRSCLNDKEFEIVAKWEKDNPSADPALVTAMKAATTSRCSGVDVTKIQREMAEIHDELVYKSDTCTFHHARCHKLGIFS
jgi:hypothetical protein